MIQYSIEELHDLFLSGKLQPQDYYDELFEEVSIQQKRLNAFVTITKEKAYHDLKETDFHSLLNGIPYVLKDNFSTDGIKTTASSRMLENYVPIYNAYVVERINQQGSCLIGKSSMDELGMGDTNKTALTGPVYNPWDSSRIAGGSSGGSAALVGSGVVPFALGSDTGDSVRKPAGFCGVVGFKPTWGRISRYGLIPFASSLDHVGILTRNVRDIAIVLEVIAGRDDKDMTSSMYDVPHYLENLTHQIEGIKIGVLKTVVDEIHHPEIKKNFKMICKILKDHGATVNDVTISKDLMKAILPAYHVIANCEATSNHACLDGIKYGNREEGHTVEEIMIHSRTKGFSQSTQSHFLMGQLALEKNNQEKMLKKAQCVRKLLVNELNHIYEEYDLILTPNSGFIAPHIDEKPVDRLSEDNIIIENHLCLGNFAGTPSLSLPSGFVDGMPIAINLMGRLFEEQTVLNVAYALENILGLKNQFSREG